MLEKSKEEETSMEDILLNIRDTPLDANTPSPYELMFHRKVKSNQYSACSTAPTASTQAIEV